MCHIIEGLLHWNWNLTTLILFCLNSIPRFATHTSCTAAAIKCFQEAISFNPLRDPERCNGTATKGNFIQRSSGWVTSISFVKKSRQCFHSTLLMMSISRKKKKRDAIATNMIIFSFRVCADTCFEVFGLILHSPFRLDAKNRKDLGEASRTFKCARNCGILVWLLWLEEDPDSITMSHETNMHWKKNTKRVKKNNCAQFLPKFLVFNQCTNWILVDCLCLVSFECASYVTKVPVPIGWLFLLKVAQN